MKLICKSNKEEIKQYSFLGKKQDSTFNEYDLTVGKEYQIEFSSYKYNSTEYHIAHITGDKGFFSIKKRGDLSQLYNTLNQLFKV